jgi:carbon storage regulator CsrA
VPGGLKDSGTRKDGEIMLVLSRKRGEGVVIGRGIEVIVLEVRGGRVKLGFNGPPEVTIHRGEVYAKIAACPAGCPSVEHP